MCFLVSLKDRVKNRERTHLLICSPRCPQRRGLGQAEARSQELATGLQHGQQGPTQASLLSSRVHFNRTLAPQENRALIRHKGVPSGVLIASVSNKEENVPSILRGKKLTFSSIYSDSIAEQ